MSERKRRIYARKKTGWESKAGSGGATGPGKGEIDATEGPNRTNRRHEAGTGRNESNMMAKGATESVRKTLRTPVGAGMLGIKGRCIKLGETVQSAGNLVVTADHTSSSFTSYARLS